MAGLIWQGVWSSSTSYAVHDAVAYNGSSYISIQAGSNHDPETSSTFWTLLAQVGSSGSPGLSGSHRRHKDPAVPAGTAGAAGPQGATRRPIGATGPAGLNWQGTWDTATAYEVNDAVAYNGSSYISHSGGNQSSSPIRAVRTGPC
jgi:hypothetical protein